MKWQDNNVDDEGKEESQPMHNNDEEEHVNDAFGVAICYAIIKYLIRVNFIYNLIFKV